MKKTKSKSLGGSKAMLPVTSTTWEIHSAILAERVQENPTKVRYVLTFPFGRVAAFMLLIGEVSAKTIYYHLEQNEREVVALHIADLHPLSLDEQTAILKEFYQRASVAGLKNSRITFEVLQEFIRLHPEKMAEAVRAVLKEPAQFLSSCDQKTADVLLKSLDFYEQAIITQQLYGLSPPKREKTRKQLANFKRFLDDTLLAHAALFGSRTFAETLRASTN